MPNLNHPKLSILRNFGKNGLLAAPEIEIHLSWPEVQLQSRSGNSL